MTIPADELKPATAKCQGSCTGGTCRVCVLKFYQGKIPHTDLLEIFNEDTYPVGEGLNPKVSCE